MTGYTSIWELTRMKQLEATNARLAKIRAMEVSSSPIHIGITYTCPNCCKMVGIESGGRASVYYYKRCSCGQLLDWEDIRCSDESIALLCES